ncbi:MAG: hypothetical protein HWD60_06635 [Defluviicoccus sp.]|nr:MAG: hypothetical protein HWD60_06635 [Defluviicoccus sp.]
MMPWTLILDLVMTLLLAATIVATIMLNRRLNGLRDARCELESLAERFQASTSRADEGVAGLKMKAQSLQELVETVRGLSSDLEFLIERGSTIADRLEADVRTARRTEGRTAVTAGVSSAGASRAAGVTAGAPVAAPPAANARTREGAELRSEAERHLMAALRSRA